MMLSEIGIKQHNFRLACENNKIADVKFYLKDPNFNPAFTQNVSLRLACRDGNFEIVKLLVADERVDPSFPANDALHLASLSRNEEMVEFLLKDERVRYPYFQKEISLEEHLKYLKDYPELLI